MRALFVASCVAVCGCASTGPRPSSPAPVESVRVIPGGGPAMNVMLTSNSSPKGGVVAVPVDRAWGVMRAVYDSLGIPVTIFDPASHSIGNDGLRIKRRLGEVALSKYINCGNAQGFPSADTYDVFLSVTTHVRAEPSGGTRVETLLDGRARPITISGEYVSCSTLTTLEARVVAVVNNLVK